MPNTPSAKKALRQTKKRAARNKARRSQMRTTEKKAVAALQSKDIAQAAPAVRAAESALDKSVSKGILHKNAAARRKSRLAKKLNALSSPA